MSIAATLLVPLASIFLNGVNIDGLRSQVFEKCKTVRVDERGDVHLDCPGYEAQAAGEGSPTAPLPAPPLALAAAGLAPAISVPQKLSRRYWLVTEQAQGGAPYDVDVYLNNRWLRRLRAGEGPIVMEVTKLVQAGQNRFLFASGQRKDVTGRPPAPGAYLKAVVGEGDWSGGTVVIDNPLLECTRTAADGPGAHEEFTVQGR